MNQKDLIELCLRNLLRRRTRTILAVIGVIVGTCAIVVMLSIGFGLSASFQKQIESYGNLQLINVSSNGGGMMASSGMGGNGSPGGATGVINDKTIMEMEKTEGVVCVTPVVSEYMLIAIGKNITQAEVVGIRAEVLEKFNYAVQEGRLLKPTDKYGILFGNQIPNWFYNPKRPNDMGSGEPVKVITDKIILTGDMEYGQTTKSTTGDTGTGTEQKLSYKEYKARGVGVLANPSDESAYVVYMNIDEVLAIQKENRKVRKEIVSPTEKGNYQRAMIYVADINKVEKISKGLREQGYQTNSANDWLQSMKQTARMIQGILGGIGGISLFVAALGITNTMIMSIYERTKEIGVMKVIGANLQDIKRMFLVEAGLIGFIGGAAGIVISFILSFLMNTLLGTIIGAGLGIGDGSGETTVSIIPWWIVIGALAFATVIGVVAGYYPAKRAMNLSALESLRNE